MHFRRTTLFLAFFLAMQTAAQAQTTERVEVVGTSPLPGLGVDKNKIAAPVQTGTAKDLQNATDLSSYINSHLGSVHTSSDLGNPLHVDLSFRGFNASPDLGAPQGIAVYLDGMRMNQPFGDVMSWELIQKSAIRSFQLMPGANPLFGLNSLGGAISIQSKDGLSHQGLSGKLAVGDYGRQIGEVAYGYADNGRHAYISGSWFKEKGWREDSPTRVAQLFASVGHQHGDHAVKLTAGFADTQLQGSGLQTTQFLDKDYASGYTKPDKTDAQSAYLNALFEKTLGTDSQISGNLYHRMSKSKGFNGDVNEASLSQSVYQPSADDRAALAAAGYSGYPMAGAGATAANTPFPYWRCIAQTLQKDEPAEKCTGLITRSDSKQGQTGLNLQWTHNNKSWGLPQQWLVGTSLERSTVKYLQSSEYGYLLPNRTVVGTGAYANGVDAGIVDDVPVDARVNINSKQEVVSVFVSDLVSLTPDTHLTLSARANHVRVSTLDNIHPSGNIESLTARHRFSSLNPAIGLVMGIAPKAQFYAGFNQTNRTPTAIELGCANPERPCRLPNAMQSDPPLKQVLAQNLELGVRGQLAHSSWRAGVFHTLSKNDILFVADDQSGYGYFKNFGKTRRQGVELGLNSKLGALSLGANYSYIDATFRSHEQVNGGSNSSNEGSGPGLEGNIDIKPGNKIPLTPAHQFKFNLGYQFTPEWSVNNQVLAFSSQYARGNENNAHVADGKYYQGAGKVAGYALWNLDSTYQVSKNWGVHFGIHNLLDRRYATAGQLGVNAFNAAGNYQARPYAAVNGEYPLNHTLFLAPGAPRQFYLHLNFTF